MIRVQSHSTKRRYTYKRRGPARSGNTHFDTDREKRSFKPQHRKTFPSRHNTVQYDGISETGQQAGASF